MGEWKKIFFSIMTMHNICYKNYHVLVFAIIYIHINYTYNSNQTQPLLILNESDQKTNGPGCKTTLEERSHKKKPHMR